MIRKGDEGLDLNLKYKPHRQREANTPRASKTDSPEGTILHRGGAVLEIPSIFQIVASMSDCLIALLVL